MLIVNLSGTPEDPWAAESPEGDAGVSDAVPVAEVTLSIILSPLNLHYTVHE